MSDVAYTPAPAPAPAPAGQSEVPINPNPTSAPAPLTNQPPEKAPDAKPPDRREAIQRAFDKAKERTAPEPRKARMGDNNPPEPMAREREKPKLEPIDLKKRPDDQPKAEPRERAEHGHFAPRSAEGTPQVSGRYAEGTPQVSGQAPRHAQLPEGTPYRDPPQRMDEQAKSQWAATPEPVRGAVHRMNQEFARAYQRYKPDIDVFETIRPFHEMARQQGTTLERAMHNYTSMEQKLRTDVVGGLDIIVHNLNLRAPDGTQLGLKDVAWHILNQSPEQHKLTQAQNAQTAQSHQIGQLHREISQLASGMQQMHYERQFHQTRSALDRYADAHPRFDELGDLIEREVKLGFNLDQAYRRAELLRPGTHAAQTRTAPAQTRPPGRSISGAPAGSSNGTGRRPDKPVGRREAIANAIKRASGSF